MSGNTNLCGVFIADNIRGTSTVITQIRFARYVFHRGAQHLGPSPRLPSKDTSEDASQVEDSSEPAGQSGEDLVLERVFDRNSGIQVDNDSRHTQLYFNKEERMRMEAVKQ